MPSSQSTTLTDISLQNTHRYSQLHALGVDIYVPLQQLNVAELPWLQELCQLLNISRTDCIFDAMQPAFDDNLKKLHLPASTNMSESDLKKSIWQHVRQFVI